MTVPPSDLKMKHLALTYLAKWDEDPNLFLHIELLQKVLIDIENKGTELSDTLKEATAQVAHLDGKDSLTEDEMYEYSSATGWIDTAIEEYQAHREVIAESVLIALAKMIETRVSAGVDLIVRYSSKYQAAQGSTDGSKIKKLWKRLLSTVCERLGRRPARRTPAELEQIKRKLTWHLCRQGPKVRNAFWAEAVRVGGNYVRHREEWKVFPYKQVTHNGQKYLQRLPGSLVSMLESSQARANAQVIVALGIPERDFLEHRRELGFKMVNILGLNKVSTMAPQFGDWMEAMTKHVKTEIGLGTP